MKIDLAEARWVALHAQGLDEGHMPQEGSEGIEQVIARLGHVQIDTISVVERAHHHILWARSRRYDPQWLHDLQANGRRIFEYWWRWGASYLPMEDYRFYATRMRAFAAAPKTRRWCEQNAELVASVLRRIREEGPLGSADFAAPPGARRSGWWDWKPAKVALETLFSMGTLMVAERRSFQRVYDLTERVLPAGTSTAEPSQEELARFVVRRALRSDGLATEADMRFGLSNPEVVFQALRVLVDSGEVVPIAVDGVRPDGYYALSGTLAEACSGYMPCTRVHLLSPFDNLVARRGRLRELFGFDYALECYLPAAKRLHGYFSLPILWGDRFVGRVDAKAERRKCTLVLRSLELDPGVDCRELLPALSARIRDYASFNGCNEVVLERATPEDLRGQLLEEL